MPFCIKCGTKIENDDKFCPECGFEVEINTVKPTTQERNTDFEGKIIKCPLCGEVIPSFSSNCPACGYEFRKANASSTVKELSDKLEAIDFQSKHTHGKFNSLNKLSGMGIVSEEDKKKISLIKSFPIPNTKEDIMEFLILASSNVDLNCQTQREIEISEAWESKFKQAYQKAKILFQNDSRITEIEKIYADTIEEIKKSKTKDWKLVGILWGIIVVLFAICFTVLSISNSKAEKKEIQRLEKVIVQVEDSYDNKDYKLALMYAKNLDYMKDDEQLDAEWQSKQEYWIDKILTTAESEGQHLKYEPPNTTTTTTTDT